MSMHIACDLTPGKPLLAKCLNRVELLHADVAKTRSDIVAACDSTLIQLEECMALVRARRIALLAQLDDIEIRRTVDIETAIVAAESLQEIKESEGSRDPATLSVIRSSRMFYAIQSMGKVDWTAIREHAMQMFEFKEFPVFECTEAQVHDGKISLKIPDSVSAWGTPAARKTFIENVISVSMVTRDGGIRVNGQYTLTFSDTTLTIVPTDKSGLHQVFVTTYFAGKTLHEPVLMIFTQRRCKRWDMCGGCGETACPHFHGYINRVCRFGDKCRDKDHCPARHPVSGASVAFDSDTPPPSAATPSLLPHSADARASSDPLSRPALARAAVTERMTRLARPSSCSGEALVAIPANVVEASAAATAPRTSSGLEMASGKLSYKKGQREEKAYAFGTRKVE